MGAYVYLHQEWNLYYGLLFPGSNYFFKNTLL